MNEIVMKISHKLDYISKMRHFNQIYPFLLAVVSVIGWRYQMYVGMGVLIVIGILATLFLKDVKFAIPSIMYLIFNISSGFSNSKVPIFFIIEIVVFILFLIIYSIINGYKLKKMKSLYGLIGFAVMNFLPIFWCNTIPADGKMLYCLFFMNFVYLIIYMVLVNTIKSDSINLLATTISYLALIMALECAFMVYDLKDTTDNILNLWYYMGWGLCNEAGIMICFSIPFIFYLMAKSDSIAGIFIENIKVLVAVIGIILTTSRGTYLIGFTEIAVLYIALLFVAKRIKVYQNFFLGLSLVGICILIIFKNYTIEFINSVLDNVFSFGFNDTGRSGLWSEAIDIFTDNPLNIILGAGYNATIRELQTAAGIQLGPQVYHSTILQTAVMGGIFGLLILIYHLACKYINLCKCEKVFFLIIGIGFIFVDIYGLIDNTYYMYYFMIPLMVVLASIDSSLYYKNNDIKE